VRVSCDAGADDDGGRNTDAITEPPVGEVDRVDSFDALQLVDG